MSVLIPVTRKLVSVLIPGDTFNWIKSPIPPITFVAFSTVKPSGDTQDGADPRLNWSNCPVDVPLSINAVWEFPDWYGILYADPPLKLCAAPINVP